MSTGSQNIDIYIGNKVKFTNMVDTLIRILENNRKLTHTQGSRMYSFISKRYKSAFKPF